MGRVMRKPALTKTQMNCAADQRLATYLVLLFYFLNLKFQASNNLLWLYSLDCVETGRKPRRQNFSRRGSYNAALYQNFMYDPVSFCNIVPFVIMFQWPYPMGICYVHVFRGLNGVHQVTAVSRTCGCSFVQHN